MDHVNQIQEVVQTYFSGEIDKLRPVKEKLEEKGSMDISYFEIKIAKVMMEEKK
ncbi:MAG: hypothetical protein U9Q15_00320 [Patescibacteria group bacterium]|nr:hypothetical protein [Patescibacteria group bacterium]